MVLARVMLAGAMLATGCGRIDFDPLGSPGSDGSVTDADAAMPMITRGQVVHPPDTAATQVDAAITFTPGTVLVVGAAWADSSQSIAMSDSAGHVWVPTPRQTIPSGCFSGLGGSVQMFYAPITASGSGTVTLTQSGGTAFASLFVAEYSGLATPVVLDGTTGQIAGAISNQMVAGTLTTTRFDVIVALFHDSMGGGVMVPGPGLTTLAIDTSAYALFGEAMLPPGSHTITSTLPVGVSDACWKGAALALAAQ